AASSSNGLGFGWTPRGRSADGSTFTGLLRLSGEAPDGVEAVVVRWNGRDREVPVTSGYFFFGVWEVQEDFDDASGYPHVLAHIKAGGAREVVPPTRLPSAPGSSSVSTGKAIWKWPVRSSPSPSSSSACGSRIRRP